MPLAGPGPAEQRLSFLESVIEHLPIGVIVMDRKGKVLLMNRWQENISLVRREQVIGGYFHEKWERLFKQGIMSDYWKLLDDGTPFQRILHDVYPQFYDRKISAISRGARIEGHDAFILMHDVSSEIQEDKRGLERLTRQFEEQTNFLTNLIDSSPNVVITTDSDGVIRSVNRTGETLLEYQRDELVGRDIGLVLEGHRDKDRLWSIMRTGRPVEVGVSRRSGRTFPARMQVRDIRDRSGVNQAKLYLITDISYEKSMEEKLAFSEKLALYSELMAGIAHQLNNPLVGVANFSSLLLEKTLTDDPNRGLVETIHEAAQRCRTMLATMIKSLREPTSTFHLLDLGEVLIRALESVPGESCSRKLVVERDIPQNLPAVRGDSIQLLEVFRNLIDNALQAMPDGGRLDIKAAFIAEEQKIRIVVADTGPGVPAELEERIFDPFFTTKKGTGAGLGLSFAYRVIQNHAGRIEVKPAVPRGCSFEVTLPLHLNV